MATADIPEDSRTRFAKETIVVVDVFGEMLREISTNLINPMVMHTMIQNTDLNKKINFDEKKKIPSLLTDGFRQCDTGLLYKFLRHLIPAASLPSQGWGKSPGINEVTLGDDVERIRITRNHILHRHEADVSEQEHSDFFVKVGEIARRIDLYLNKVGDDCYEQKTNAINSKSLSSELEEKYYKMGLEMEELKLQLSRKMGNVTYKVYAGKTMELILEVANDQELDIAVKGLVHEKEVVSKLKSMIDDINNGNYSFRIISIESGCILMNVCSKLSFSKTEIYREIPVFLQSIFDALNHSIGSTTIGDKEIDVYLFPGINYVYSDQAETTEIPKEIDDFYYYASTPKEGDIRFTIRLKESKPKGKIMNEASTLVSNMLEKTNEIHHYLDVAAPIELDILMSKRGFQ